MNDPYYMEYLTQVTDRLKQHDYNIKYDNQHFEYVAKRTKFEIVRFGFFTTFFMFGKYTTQAIGKMSIERTQQVVEVIKNLGGEVNGHLARNPQHPAGSDVIRFQGFAPQPSQVGLGPGLLNLSPHTRAPLRRSNVFGHLLQDHFRLSYPGPYRRQETKPEGELWNGNQRNLHPFRDTADRTLYLLQRFLDILSHGHVQR